MKNGTNLFFLAVAVGVGVWAFGEYRKQREAQQRLLLQRNAEAVLDRQGNVVDYAEAVARERDWLRQASIYGG